MLIVTKDLKVKQHFRLVLSAIKGLKQIDAISKFASVSHYAMQNHEFLRWIVKLLNVNIATKVELWKYMNWKA